MGKQLLFIMLMIGIAQLPAMQQSNGHGGSVSIATAQTHGCDEQKVQEQNNQEAEIGTESQNISSSDNELLARIAELPEDIQTKIFTKRARQQLHEKRKYVRFMMNENRSLMFAMLGLEGGFKSYWLFERPVVREYMSLMIASDPQLLSGRPHVSDVFFSRVRDFVGHGCKDYHLELKHLLRKGLPFDDLEKFLLTQFSLEQLRFLVTYCRHLEKCAIFSMNDLNEHEKKLFLSLPQEIQNSLKHWPAKKLLISKDSFFKFLAAVDPERLEAWCLLTEEEEALAKLSLKQLQFISSLYDRHKQACRDSASTNPWLDLRDEEVEILASLPLQMRINLMKVYNLNIHF